MKRILAYSDRLSVRAGETVRVMVSCEDPAGYRAGLVRVVCGDSRPTGPGVKETPVQTASDGSYPGRVQRITAGSYGRIDGAADLGLAAGVSLGAMIWPTKPTKGRQTILARWSEQARTGFNLEIDEAGGLALLLGDGTGGLAVLRSGKPLLAREWYLAAASYDAKSGEARLYQIPLARYPGVDDGAEVAGPGPLPPPGAADAPVLIAARGERQEAGGYGVGGHYNGKIDSPRLVARACSRDALAALVQSAAPVGEDEALVGFWDLSKHMTQSRIADLSSNRLDGELVNLPARAMTGWNWTGEEMCWRRAPGQYGAVHFHDDDLYDAGWEADFSLTLPESLPSGVYAAKLTAADDEEYVPLFVRPPKEGPANDVAYLASTATYMAYANKAWDMETPLAESKKGGLLVLQPHDAFLYEHPEYGLSLYDSHSDGLGACYSSRLRPILNMRPKTQLWSLNADTHVTDWLDAMDCPFDVVTDEDLHAEGADALAPYRVVVTGSHPEYWSTPMWRALRSWRDGSGRLLYLGGNGFYWRIALSDTLPGVIEVRRAEGGMRYWSCKPGEAYHSFTGEYGGLWRRLGTPPHALVEAGTVATGFDSAAPYRRRPASDDPRARFIFEGIGEDEVIGDFGAFGGAAGIELEGYDRAAGSPPHALVVASSDNHSPLYFLTPEETPFHHPLMNGAESERVRADMVFFETPGGGGVFATGSIAWAASLAHDGYDNNVSRITLNVLARFRDPAPF